MPLEKLTTFTKKVSDLADKPNATMTAASVKAQFDAAPDEVRAYLNQLIDVLQSVVDGDSGADNIKATAIAELTGTTVQSLLESLKALVDNKSNSIDVFSKTDLQSVTDGNSGADLLKATPISTSPNTVQGILEWLKTQIDSTVLGQIPDGSITDAKLSNNPSEVKQTLNAHQADYLQHTGYAVATGPANAYVATLNPALSAYAEGVSLRLKINAANTGASTVNVNGLGAKAILKGNGNAVSAGNLKVGIIYTLAYDGTSFILQGEGGSGNAVASDLLSGKTASTDAGDIVGTLALTGDATNADVLTGKTYYNTDAKTKQTGTLIPGKNFASGTITNTGGMLSFRAANESNVYNEFFIQVTGLTFKPSFIEAIYKGSVGDSGSVTTYCKDKNFLSNFPKGVIDMHTTKNLPSTSLVGYVLSLDGVSAYTTETGFRLPVENANSPYEWIAYE